MAKVAKRRGGNGKATATKKRLRPDVPSLVLDLYAPGMTPLLRAGLGGLAAALRFVLLECDTAAEWPAPVPIGGGHAIIEPRRITLAWDDATPAEVLKALFESAFRLPRTGIIALAGTFEPSAPLRRPVTIMLQDGLKRTFLQHGKSTEKNGNQRTASDEVDDQRFTFEWQPYGSFAHQGAWELIDAALTRNTTVELAGWSYPGAAQKHVGFSETKCEYSAAQAMAACFAITGCLSFDVRPGRLGALIIPEPTDLVEFAITRPRLTPRSVEDAVVASLGDALLLTEVALRMDKVASKQVGVGATLGVLLKALPWATQQKSRARTLDVESIPESTLEQFFRLKNTLRTRLLAKPTAEDEETDGGYFVATSALRAFVADNLAVGHRWFDGFATATTGGKKPRFLHYYRDRDNLGALYPEERKGLVIMIENLDAAEKALVLSVHTALRQRFGRIFEETKALPGATRKNRFSGERERWRISFAGSKTHDQIRAALASLWSLAGPNQELRASWEQIVPLLRPRHWQVARDLALVALVSYQSAAKEEDDDSTPNDPSAE